MKVFIVIVAIAATALAYPYGAQKGGSGYNERVIGGDAGVYHGPGGYPHSGSQHSSERLLGDERGGYGGSRGYGGHHHSTGGSQTHGHLLGEDELSRGPQRPSHHNQRVIGGDGGVYHGAGRYPESGGHYGHTNGQDSHRSGGYGSGVKGHTGGYSQHGY